MVVLQVHTEKELVVIINNLKKEIEQLRDSDKEMTKKLTLMQVEIDKKPNVTIKETLIKHVEKPTLVENTLIKTDASVIPSIKKLVDRIKVLEDKKPDVQIIKETFVEVDSAVRPTLKKLSGRLRALEDKKPEVQIIKNTVVEVDSAVMPTLKKLSARVKTLEDKKPELQIIKELTTHEVKTVSAASKKEIDDIKKSILQIKPVVNNLTKGVSSQDVLELIKKHVTMNHINKLYGR